MSGCGGSAAAAAVTPPPPPPAGITVAPGQPATAAVSAEQTSKLTATISNDTNHAGVTWKASVGTVAGIDAGCSSGSSCCPNGTCAAIYTAPEDVSAASATITATSVSDSSKTATESVTLTSGSTWEDLVAYYNGIGLKAPKPWTDLEVGAAASGTFQADRIIFHEIFQVNGQAINTEVWRLDNDAPPVSTKGNPPTWGIPGTLNRTPWNANGSLFDLAGTPGLPFPLTSCSDIPNEAGCDGHNFLFDAAADTMQEIRPTVVAGAADHVDLSGARYLAWDRVNPKLFYSVTSNDSAPNPPSELYAVDATNGFLMTPVLALPQQTDPITSAVVPKEIQSYLSANDIVMVKDVNAPAQATLQANGTLGDYVPNIYMVDVRPGDAQAGTIVDQFAVNFSIPTIPVCDPLLDCTQPFKALDQHGFHDIYFQRDSQDHFIFNYGPQGDVGETMFFQASLDGKTVVQAYPNSTGTGVPFMGHPATNFDGTLIAYGGFDTAAHQKNGCPNGGLTCAGSFAWQFNAGGFNGGAVSASLGSFPVGHEGWDGFDSNYIVYDGYTSTAGAGCNPASPVLGPSNPCLQDWSEISANPVSDPQGLSPRILVHDGQRDPNQVANDQMIGIDIGPVQSPDATKMMFSLPNQLNASPTDLYDTMYSTYMAVDHRPAPPVLGVTGTSPVSLSWTAHSPHLEVAGYHVYRSSDGTSWSEVSGAGNTGPFGSMPAVSVCSADGSTCTFSDASATTGSTVFYAVTAQEYSGLESSQLSNVMKVTVGGSATQTAAAGTAGWDTTAPAPPTGVTATKLSAAGEWKISWTASASPNVRYYDLFYGGGNMVPAIASTVDAQHYLIASPSAANTSYIYWEANPNDVPVFGIVAVDRQDNFSTLACVYTLKPGASCP